MREMPRVLVYSHEDVPLRELSASEVMGLERTEELGGTRSLEVKTTAALSKGQRVLTRGATGAWREHVVVGSDESHDSGASAVGTYHCEWSVQHDLEGRVVTAEGPGSGAGAASALAAALSPTRRWSVGEVTQGGIGSGDFRWQTSWRSVQDVLGTWGGELRPDVSVGATGVVRRALSLLAAPEGQAPARRLDWDGGVSSIRRRVSEDTLCCRVLPLGKGGGSDGRRVTIADANGGVEWLQSDEVAAVTRMPDGSGGWEYPTKVITNENAADAATLLAWARSVLARETTPKVTYEATLAGLADAGMDVSGLRLGDAVQCVDDGFFEGRPLRVEARVTRLSVDELKGGATVTIGSVWGLGMTVATLERRIEDAERTARDAKNQNQGGGQGHDDVTHTLDGVRITKGTIAFTTEKKQP